MLLTVLKPKPFSPLQKPGALVWLSANRMSSLTEGGAVSQWDDLSGNGRNATQGTGANQPTYRQGNIGGMPAVVFDGTDDYLELGAAGWLAEGTTPFAIAIVYRITQTTTENFVLSSSGNPATKAGMFIDYRGDTLNDQMDSRCGDGVAADSVSPALSASGTHIYILHRDGTNLEGWLDGAAHGTATDNAINFNTTDQLRIGAQSPTAGIYLNGSIAELVIYDSAMTVGERNRMFSGWGRQYSISISY